MTAAHQTQQCPQRVDAAGIGSTDLFGALHVGSEVTHDALAILAALCGIFLVGEAATTDPILAIDAPVCHCAVAVQRRGVWPLDAWAASLCSVRAGGVGFGFSGDAAELRGSLADDGCVAHDALTISYRWVKSIKKMKDFLGRVESHAPNAPAQRPQEEKA